MKNGKIVKTLPNGEVETIFVDLESLIKKPRKRKSKKEEQEEE
tara:strand:+ start:134 stop:262 length:129 start_codon:yes stop_codon:yes gene_type:complete